MKSIRKKRAILSVLCAVLLIAGVLQLDSVQMWILSFGLYSSNRVTKEMALSRLRSYGERAVPLIASQLWDENVNARSDAASMLGEMGFPSAVKPLIESLEDTSALPRCTAALALGEIGDRSAIPALKNTLKHESTSTRLIASMALAHLGNDSGVVNLVRGLESNDQWIRSNCFVALEKLTGKTFGYDPEQLPLHQGNQIALWQEWLNDWRSWQSTLADSKTE